MEMSIHQKITDDKGRVKEKTFDVLMAKFGDEDKTKMTMQQPERAAGITIVFTKTPFEDRIIEVYTPANGKTRKMLATPKNMKTVGSDFAISNYSSRTIEDLDIRLLGKPEIDGKMCYKLEVQEKANSKEGRAELIVEQESFHIIQIITYNEKGVKSTVSKFSDFQVVEGMKNKVQPMLILTDNLLDKQHAEMKILEITPKNDLKEEEFMIDATSN
jgi:outer membrane lipoprotein-sorting protein